MAQIPLFLRKQNETVKVTRVTFSLTFPTSMVFASSFTLFTQETVSAWYPDNLSRNSLFLHQDIVHIFLACILWCWLLNDLPTDNFISFLSCLSFSPQLFTDSPPIPTHQTLCPFPSIKTKFCYPNIIGYVVSNWRMIDLSGCCTPKEYHIFICCRRAACSFWPFTPEIIIQILY